MVDDVSCLPPSRAAGSPHQSLTVDEESLAARGAAEFLPGHSALSGSLSIIIIVVVGLLNSTEAKGGGNPKSERASSLAC